MKIYNINKITKYTIIWIVLSILISIITFTPIVKSICESVSIANYIIIKNLIGLIILPFWFAFSCILICTGDYICFSKYLEKHYPEINKYYQKYMKEKINNIIS